MKKYVEVDLDYMLSNQEQSCILVCNDGVEEEIKNIVDEQNKCDKIFFKSNKILHSRLNNLEYLNFWKQVTIFIKINE